jgi:hypothetical protein
MPRLSLSSHQVSAAIGFGAFCFSCAGILGVEDLGGGDISADGGSGNDSSTADGSAPPPVVIACQIDAECTDKAPATTPAGCASAKCLAQKCVFVAKDADGDGVPGACSSQDGTKPVIVGPRVDCDDTNPGVVPGSEIDCTDNSFMLPGKGACKAGKKRCNNDGAFGACIGVIGKKTEVCDNGLDEDCDGNIDNGCTCASGSPPRACGPAAKGICKPGTQTCTNATWGNCEGAVFPKVRDCLSADDNDCNGVPDRDEAECLCDRAVKGGTARDCQTGQSGICAAGAQTCNVGSGGAAWGACTPKTPAQGRNCASGNDNDCNGKADNAEPECACQVGATQNCGTGQPGICAAGTQTCVSTGNGAAFGPCMPIKTAAARDCNSAADNNCNGAADNTESECRCDGVTLIGAGRGCNSGQAGICAAGTQVCVNNGNAAGWGACRANSAPAARDCGSGNDNNCNGAADNTEGECRCDGNAAIGQTRGCASGQAGICSAGTQTCVNGGGAAGWSTCGANTGPQAINCTNGADNNCDGAVDSQQGACLCDGTVGNGGTGACSTGLAGICAAGTRTCSVSAAGAAWGGCVQTTGAAARDCDSSADNDCNGLADNQETACKCGTYFVGQSRQCGPRFEPGLDTCISFGSTAGWSGCDAGNPL